ncbi:cytochrome C [Thioclava dalianensis]|uniref:Cytochrome C n=1 Tax=Thioclava dalianensis TaxID=1185766 RepID=A0A074THE9_9RHOB|nr:c-type cytochrome biogenesis protein CcmI [Thioclava dalianensis]KEP71089.1 cytochrome C [Thioclava dalianensis]SFN25055.1 cytochrome c-type biogenesis protein CcmH [Thioclava dalianensis]
MLFWIIAVALVVIIALMFVLAVRSGRGTAHDPSAAYDVQVYRDQLRDSARDAERGVISPEEAERTRLEISRRMLEADRIAQNGADSTRAPRAALVALALGGAAVIGATFWLYLRTGAEGYADQPIAERYAFANERYDSRPDQAKAEELAGAQTAEQPKVDPKFLALMDKLRAAVKANPTDRQGLVLLARNEATLGNFDAAWKAQKRLIALEGDSASAHDYAELGELMVVAAGGLVTPEAEAAFAQALKIDPKNGLSLYYIGLMMIQNAREDRAFTIWDGLLRNSPDDAPWVPTIRKNINELAWLAGQNDYTPPAPRTSGPSQADIAAAAQMDPAARQQMIQGMVDQLSDRLARQGGPVDDWARLISSLRLIGETERADAIYAEARDKFAGQPSARAQLDAAHAVKAGDLASASEGSAQVVPPALPGPTPEQMQDAQQMAPAERAQMIQGMVDGLFDRLTTQGGTPAEWARLVSSLATLGQDSRAREALGEASQALAGDPEGLAKVQAAAKAAGVAQ